MKGPWWEQSIALLSRDFSHLDEDFEPGRAETQVVRQALRPSPAGAPRRPPGSAGSAAKLATSRPGSEAEVAAFLTAFQ